MMQCLVNPLCLFLLVWGVATASYAAGVWAGTFPFPGIVTVAAVLLSIVTFCLGYLTWSLFRRLEPEPADSLPALSQSLTVETLFRPLRFTLLMGVLALGLEMYRTIMIASYFETPWLDLVTHPELFRIQLVTYIGENIFRTSYVTMLLSLTSSVFSIGFVLLGVVLYLDPTGRKYVYLAAFLLISLIVGLIHLSRQEMTANAAYLALAYCFMLSLDRSKADISGRESSHGPHRTWHIGLLIPVAAVMLLFGLIDVLLHKSSTYDQPNVFQGFLFQVYWYVAAPLAAFNEFVTTFGGDHQWGLNTFLPLYKWLCRLQLVPEADISVYGQMMYIPYPANVYTYLRSFYEDFGLLGVAVAPYLLGWATAVVRLQARRHFQFLNLYVVLLAFILFSFYNYFAFSNQIYLQVFFGFVFFRYELWEQRRFLQQG